jgi:metal-responsive CopG/Arc/MetJ family transcriptional regulator
MTMETERINITLQKDIALELKRMTSPRKRSAFINEAIRLRIEQSKREELEFLMEEGYKARASENLKLSKDFEQIDLENWDEY